MRLFQPFTHPELSMGGQERRDADYTDELISLLQQRASGADASTDTIAVVEVCAGLWSRAFASAKVMPETMATAALSPSVLAAMGRRLLTGGEYLGELRIQGGALRIVEASSWDVDGDLDAWVYRADFPTPDGFVTRTLDSSRVVHPRIGSDRSEPWRGNGPLRKPITSLQLAARLELSLAYEAGGPIGTAIPTPHEDDDDLEKLQAALAGLKGKVVLVETTAGAWKAGDNQLAPRRDWQTVRIGPNPPQSIGPLRGDVNASLMAAAGVPVALLQHSDGTHLRESWRQFLYAAISPVAEIVADELAEKLDAPGLHFDFSALAASDIAGRARAFGSLVQGGMAVEQALAVTGLLVGE